VHTYQNVLIIAILFLLCNVLINNLRVCGAGFERACWERFFSRLARCRLALEVKHIYADKASCKADLACGDIKPGAALKLACDLTGRHCRVYSRLTEDEDPK
jgi:hypothetical protein